MTYQIDLLEALGVDADTFDWRQLASCDGMDTNLFFDNYEGPTARQIDQLCLTCPVGKECFLDGKDNSDEGVRCGFYLINGNPDPAKNSHKSQKIAEELAAKIYGD